MNLSTINLRDCLKRTMAKNHHSYAQAAALIGCAHGSVHSFATGKVARPSRAVHEGVEEYVAVYGGYNRNAISTAVAIIDVKRKTEVLHDIEHAVKIIKHLIESGEITLEDFIKSSGLIGRFEWERFARSSFLRRGIVSEKVMNWLNKQYGLTQEMILQKYILGDTSVNRPPIVEETRDENGNMVLLGIPQPIDVARVKPQEFKWEQYEAFHAFASVYSEQKAKELFSSIFQ